MRSQILTQPSTTRCANDYVFVGFQRVHSSSLRHLCGARPQPSVQRRRTLPAVVAFASHREGRPETAPPEFVSLPKHLEFPVRHPEQEETSPSHEEEEEHARHPLVRVQLQVHYRVHSRQILCIAGSAIPFGWSFLSIAKVPMTWTPADVWTVEVELPAGSHLDYKYVVLEEQDWTRQVNATAEGKVQLEYRRGPTHEPPDVTRITKRMAIVAWQPGPNRRLQVPTLEEFSGLNPGDRFSRRALQISRTRASSPQFSGALRGYGAQALGKGARTEHVPGAYTGGEVSVPRPEELSGVWEVLCLTSDGLPLLERRDVWGREDLPPEEHQGE